MKKTIFPALLFFLTLRTASAFCSSEHLPEDFIPTVSELYRIPPEFSLSAGGKDGTTDSFLEHYPVIMIAGNKRTISDWHGKNTGNAKGAANVYDNFIKNGFSPEELWLYQYAPENREMKNIEELTDGLKWFIYSVLFYTKSTKAQILAHGEGAVLAHAAIKKYNLYNLIHAAIYIAGPFHGSAAYTPVKALTGSPVCSNLAVNSAFIRDISFPDETPFNVFENETTVSSGIKYLTIYNSLPEEGGIFHDNPKSPALSGARNRRLDHLNHDGLRCSPESAGIFIPLLSDSAIKYSPSKDKDKDGFMGFEHGGRDYNDANASIFPGAREIPEDNIDQDCNEMDILNKMGKDSLIPIKNRY